MGLGRFKSSTLFADGKAKNRDIQFRDPNFSVPESNLIIAEILEQPGESIISTEIIV